MKKIIVLLILSFLLTSCFGEKNKVVENKKEDKIIKSFENPKNDLEKQIDIRESKLVKNDIELLDLAKAYLKYGNSYYSEEIFANKALNILNKLDSEFIVEYLKGYAYEIQTKYEKALNQYDKALAFDNITDEEKVSALNQKGHIYDLKGKMEEANKYYLMAEKILPDNIKTMLNRGRYEARAGNNIDAEIYFTKVLEKTDNSFLKSEMYYNLSTIYQYKENGIEKAIEYAKLGIQANKDYPNNYLSLGVSYISSDGEDFDKAPEQLIKSIELYKNNSMAYKNLGIYYYIKDDFDKAIENFKKQVETSQKDILLMANDKEKVKVSGEYDLARTYALESDVDNSVKYLKKVLDGKNIKYFYAFVVDLSSKDSAFTKIRSLKQFEDIVSDILLKYNKK